MKRPVGSEYMVPGRWGMVGASNESHSPKYKARRLWECIFVES